MTRSAVADLLKLDHWDLVEARSHQGLALVRYRSPVLGGDAVTGYGHVVRVVWDFSAQGSRVTPSPAENDRMNAFEDLVCDAVERDARGVVAAIRTFDGLRQWVVYTVDVDECRQRLDAIPSDGEPRPVQIATETDPEWRYLRDEILKNVQWKK